MYKVNATKIKREPENWERILTTSISDKSLISKIYRELSQIYKNTSHSPVDKWSKNMNREFSEEEIKINYSHRGKNALNPYRLERWKSKQLWGTTSYLSDWLTWQDRKTINVGEDVGELEH